MQDPAGMPTTPAPPTPQRHDRNSIMGGIVLITLGVLFLIANLVPDLDFGDLWPILLIVIGGGLLWKSRQNS
jgi:phage shock protein C